MKFNIKYVIADNDLYDMGLKRIAHTTLFKGWLGNSIEELRSNVLNNKPISVFNILYTNIINDRKYLTKVEYYDADYDNVSYNYFYPKEVDL